MADTYFLEQTVMLYETKDVKSRPVGTQGFNIEAGHRPVDDDGNTCTHRHDLDENHGEVSAVSQDDANAAGMQSLDIKTRPRAGDKKW